MNLRRLIPELPASLQAQASWLNRTQKRIRRLQPLTLRGLLIALLSVVGIYAVAIPEKDLVAAVLGGGMLALLLVTLSAALLIRFRLGRRLSVEARFEQDNPRSLRDIAAGLIFKNSSIPPYFSLQAQREFVQAGPRSLSHVLIGKEPELGKRHITDKVMFPHRGLWLMDNITLRLSDALGFTCLEWSIPAHGSVEVSAQDISIKPLPIVAASSRAGDQLDQARERSGDLYDLKQYDPGDGLKRILWKTYAKTGELIVRRPEPAIIPEGEVAVYLVSGPADDTVAGALQHYLKTLREQQITVLFGTDGLHYQAASGPGQQETESSVFGKAATASAYYISDFAEIQSAINRSVWSPNAGTARDFAIYLESLAESNRHVHNVIIFAPMQGLSDGQDASWFSHLSRAAATHSIRLSVALVSKNLSFGYFGEFQNNIPSEQRFGLPHQSVLIERLLERAPKRLRETFNPSTDGRELSSAIAASGSDLFLVESYE